MGAECCVTGGGCDGGGGCWFNLGRGCEAVSKADDGDIELFPIAGSGAGGPPLPPPEASIPSPALVHRSWVLAKPRTFKLVAVANRSSSSLFGTLTSPQYINCKSLSKCTGETSLKNTMGSSDLDNLKSKMEDRVIIMVWVLCNLNFWSVLILRIFYKYCDFLYRSLAARMLLLSNKKYFLYRFSWQT